MQQDDRYDIIMRHLASLSDPAAAQGMARYGINPHNTYGISIPTLRKIAKDAGRDHHLARKLWRSGTHEARILAAFIDDPRQVTREQMDRWVKDFDSWDVCDQVCGNLFDRTPFAYEKAVEWSGREEPFVKRAGFALMAWLAVHDKRLGDEYFLSFLPIMARESGDDRNFVKKAVNWALRQVGKRNAFLKEEAVRTAREIHATGAKSARWIASDALRELESGQVQTRPQG